MKKLLKEVLVVWFFVALWVAAVCIFLSFAGCKIIEKGILLEIDDHIDKRVALLVTNKVQTLKSGPVAREIVEGGLKEMTLEYMFEGSALVFGGLASWLAGHLGLRYRKEKKKNGSK